MAIHQEKYMPSTGWAIQYANDAMKKSGERSKKMIKTDKVIYRARTQEEYDWLTEKFEGYGFMWAGGKLPTEVNNWRRYFTETCINFKDKIMMFADFDFYKNESYYKDYEFIEVSDLMANEVETDAQEKLEAIHKQVTSQIEDLRRQGKEPRAIEYTIKVCFE